MKANDKILTTISNSLQNGHTIETVREYLRKQALNEHGCARLNYPEAGFSLMYTTNPNYGQGLKNGYGPGLYAILNYVGMTKTVKI